MRAITHYAPATLTSAAIGYYARRPSASPIRKRGVLDLRASDWKASPMFSWIRDKLGVLIVGIVGFFLGIFGDDIKARFFPPAQKVEITRVTYQHGVRLADYLKVTNNDGSRFSRAQLRTRGSVVFAEVQTTGYKGDELHIAATVLTSRRVAARVPQPSHWDRFFTPVTDTS